MFSLVSKVHQQLHSAFYLEPKLVPSSFIQQTCTRSLVIVLYHRRQLVGSLWFSPPFTGCPFTRNTLLAFYESFDLDTLSHCHLPVPKRDWQLLQLMRSYSEPVMFHINIHQFVVKSLEHRMWQATSSRSPLQDKDK